ncbi:DUF6105 family protein [Antarcticirhabdus aurantiaca]|uniref:DUF6105 family protein n=1 Tax=Antarcticirhabdus aurantiaca TaxID=2606717 RepID=A0ACD4NWB4_9HYPH|nr:DUF6105 family protein [Antarcticirhabdus aurantiaca]WAJ31056.1 DUF6105 family protein [Jeongeuplla avenae]
MIRAALFGWVLPVAMLGGWFGLASNDISFGTMVLSREFYDQIFVMYGGLLGIDPAKLPGIVLNAIVVDSLIVAGIVALRHHRRVRAFVGARWRDWRGRHSSSALVRSDESLSSAP